MEDVGVEVGENPPTSPPPSEVGGHSRANGNGRQEKASADKLDEQTQRVWQLWEQKKRQPSGDLPETNP
jgi:hypothetical protein